MRFALVLIILAVVFPHCQCWSPSLGPVLSEISSSHGPLGEAISLTITENIHHLRSNFEKVIAPQNDDQKFIAFLDDLVEMGWAPSDPTFQNWVNLFEKRRLGPCSFPSPIWGNRVVCDSRSNSIVSLSLERADLPGLPESINGFQSLRSLDIKYNALAGIPKLTIMTLSHLDAVGNRVENFGFVEDLHSLTFLDVSYNDLSGASFDLLPPTLRNLTLHTCGLVEVPPALFQLSLQSLVLTGNPKITGFGAGWPGQLVSLQNLTLRGTSVSRDEVDRLGRSGLVNLMNLDLGFTTTFDSLPEAFFLGFKGSLRVFKCEKCLIESIPGSVGALASTLEELLLSRCMITRLPDELCQLRVLRFLDVSESRLQSLPSCIGDMVSLEALHIYANPDLGESALPPSLASLKHLNDLQASDCLLKDPPAWICNCTALRALNWAKNEAKEVPLCLAQLPFLSHAYFHVNEITNVRPLLAKNLQLLSVFGNRLKDFDSLDFCGADAMPALATLSVSLQPVALPESIGCLTNLTHLDAYECDLLRVPSSLSKLVKLERLNLRDNPAVAEVPSLEDTALRSLSLSAMGLSVLPRLPKLLRSLDASKNRLEKPLEICGRMTDLEMLNLSNNKNIDIFLPSENRTSGRCFPSLTTAILSNANITDLLFLTGSKLSMLDVSQNKDLGGRNVIWAVTAIGRTLRSLYIAGAGVEAVYQIAFFLQTFLAYAPGLETVDLSHNSISGSITSETFKRYGLYSNESTFATFALIDLYLDGLPILSWQKEYTARHMPVLQFLSIKNARSLRPSSIPTDWNMLRNLDVRGSFLNVSDASNSSTSADLGTQPKPVMEEGKDFKTYFWGNSTLDEVKGSSQVVNSVTAAERCPEQLSAGNTVEFSVQVDPVQYGSSLCRCLSGYYGTPGKCRRCPILPAGSTATITCENNSLSVGGGWMVFHDMTSPQDKMEGVIEIVPCPTDTDVNPCVKLVLSETVSRPKDFLDYLQRAASSAQVCREGHEDRLCSRCQRKYYRSGRSCFRCRGGTSWFIPMLTIIILTALGIRVALGTSLDDSSGLLRTGITHLQVLGNLGSMNLRLNEMTSYIMRTSASAGGGMLFDGLECEVNGEANWDPVKGPMIIGALFPVVVGLGAVWIGAWTFALEKWGPETWRSKKDLSLHTFRTRLPRIFVYLWLVLLYGALEHLLVPANCTSYGSTTKRLQYITQHMWYRCAGAEYLGLKYSGIFFAVLYTGLSLLGLYYALFIRGVEKMDPSSSQAVHLPDGSPLHERLLGADPPQFADPNQLSDSPADVRRKKSLMVLYLKAPYVQASSWWEGVAFLRRFALVLIFSLSPFQEGVAEIMVSFILVLALAFQAWRKPFQKPFDNYCETLSLALLLVTYISGLLASTQAHLKLNKLASWTLLAFNAIFLVVVFLNVFIKGAGKVKERWLGLKA